MKPMVMLFENGTDVRFHMSVKGKSCPCAQRLKHYAMKAYGGVDSSVVS
jgi:hypothetical protein